MITPAQLSLHRGLFARLAAWTFAAVAAGTLVYCAYVFLGLRAGLPSAVFSDVLYNAILVGAAVGLALRALSMEGDRVAVLLIAAGMLAWALGDVYETMFLVELENPPVPSPADALYLIEYPLFYVGLGMLLKQSRRHLGVAIWLDGLIAGLGMCALVAAFVLGPVLAATGGSTAVVATNLAYPVGDLLLFLLIITAIGLTGWRPGPMWGLLAASMLVQIVADSVYLVQIAENTYVENTWLETLWPIASLLLLAAMWAPSRPAHRPNERDWRALAVPSGGALGAMAVLYVDRGQINEWGRGLALATLLAAVVRVALAFRETRRRQRASHLQSVTDALTGLWNRRQLIEDLDRALQSATEADPWLLYMYDLNGFKDYNDSFGHPAGDSLLARLGRNLAATMAPYGRVYRMGGDEFCALVRPGEAPVDVLSAAGEHALSESGEGFEITVAYGLAVLPHDSRQASSALQLADHRLYTRKESRPAAVKHQLRGVLLEILGARLPMLAEHLDGVAELALAVGRRMKLEPEDLDVLVRAAEMHDVGKTAIPETITNKPGPLDEREWQYMRQHTIFGERILSAAPALLPVAKLVRSSHERWEGGGYPDGLAGSEIPLGSRIIAACDTFDAICSSRPYKEARSEREALAEIARCSGTQFDPDVVDALSAVVAERLGEPVPEPEPETDAALDLVPPHTGAALTTATASWQDACSPDGRPG